MAYVIAFGIPWVLVVIATVAGVLKDGSPFRRSWWT